MLVDDIAFELLKKYPFYSSLLRTCKIKINNKMKYPACVTVKNSLEVVLNEEMLRKKPLETQAGIIEHEFQHLVRRHIQQYKQNAHHHLSSKVGKPSNGMILNYAYDAEINPHIKSIVNDPKEGLQAVLSAKALIEKIEGESDDAIKAQYQNQLKEIIEEGGFVFPEFFDEKSGETWQHYYLALLSKSEAIEEKIKVMRQCGNPEDSEGDGSALKGDSGHSFGDDNQGSDLFGKSGNSEENGSDHDYFSESLDNEEVMDSIVYKALKEAKERNRGTCPSEVSEYILDFEKNQTLPWVTILRQFVHSMLSTRKHNNWKKVNRRFPGKLPGFKKEPKLKILVGLDASGSVQDEEWIEFMNEIHGIHAQGVEVYIAEFDTRITNYYKFDGIHKPRTTYGGTDFLPVHEKCLENKFDALIMFTDGYGNFAEPKDVAYRSLWVMSSDTVAPYGKSIKLPSKGRR